MSPRRIGLEDNPIKVWQIFCLEECGDSSCSQRWPGCLLEPRLWGEIGVVLALFARIFVSCWHCQLHLCNRGKLHDFPKLFF